jgi:hypothetical protein
VCSSSSLVGCLNVTKLAFEHMVCKLVTESN